MSREVPEKSIDGCQPVANGQLHFRKQRGACLILTNVGIPAAFCGPRYLSFILAGDRRNDSHQAGRAPTQGQFSARDLCTLLIVVRSPSMGLRRIFAFSVVFCKNKEAFLLI